nr:DMT family transporter [Flammeovirgaceae bacterium]
MFKDQLKLHFIVFIWGFTSILGNEISVPAVEVVFYRTLVSSLALAAIIFLLKKKFTLKWRVILNFILTGVLVGAHWILFFASAKISKISICLAGMATTTLFTAFLEPVIKKSKTKWYEVLLGLVIISGLYTIFHFEFNHVLGLSLALVSAFLAAWFSILNSQYTKVYDPVIITFYEMVGACLCCILFFPIYQITFATNGEIQLFLDQMDWINLLILSIVCTVYAFYAGIEIMKRVSAFNVNLTVNLEPVYGIIMAVILYGEKEQMSGGFYLGTLIILISVLIYPYLDKLI